MTKAELIETLAKRQIHLDKADVDSAVDCILDLISEALVANQRIEIRGFGAFSLRYRAPRQGRNPFSGEMLNLPPAYSVHFKPGKELRQRVDESRLTCPIVIKNTTRT
ncbi:integration host factor subunit beta [Methylosarcina fibrata]|uniref:integration host factor subunit beta n=1 Tax=Methylosarcina fibrata TaxID=105972 RepID=UPI0003818313|nr:integration host factor subunit beta [Methylosarcina fibrata]